MGSLLHFWQQGDAITCGVAAVLLLMSISAWVLIFWKGWLLRRVRADIARGVPAFWSAPSLEGGREQLAAFDREAVLSPLLAAATAHPTGDTLEARGQVASQLTRRLRDALHRVLSQLQFGQVVLAYNVFNKRVSACEAELEGFAHALREMMIDGHATEAAS